MDEKEILRKLGLTDYESQIILALLSIGSAKVGELSKKCSVPKNKIYESLQNLGKKGLIKEIPSTPKRYFIKNISDLEILLKQKQNELKILKDEFIQLKKIKQTKLLKTINEPVGIVYGHEAFVNRLKEALSQVKNENFSVINKIRTDPVIMRLTKEAIKRGAKIRLLTSMQNKSKLREWKKLGAKIKFIDEIPGLTFSIFDDKICRLNLNITNNLEDPTLWIENKPFINILRDKFLSIWKIAKK